eukprot:TRINITY_DN630_c0_g1_i1.p1 TRINITY_DN630_c0_g1~~TRINITY_DN630_c0_g1_i1.p1  ORF type:complete len:195 (-),score=29.38 TRINITY_DN630_c0_g1_i1:155-739(-)
MVFHDFKICFVNETEFDVLVSFDKESVFPKQFYSNKFYNIRKRAVGGEEFEYNFLTWKRCFNEIIEIRLRIIEEESITENKFCIQVLQSTKELYYIKLKHQQLLNDLGDTDESYILTPPNFLDISIHSDDSISFDEDIVTDSIIETHDYELEDDLCNNTREVSLYEATHYLLEFHKDIVYFPIKQSNIGLFNYH